jgi:oxygen-independent coproporphyrinogen-3 oxidase
MQLEMYAWLCKRLKRAEFSHYEVSNWAQPGHESRHNRRYWEQKDYLGLGLGAHSIVDGEMRENGSDFNVYLKDPMKICNEMKIDQDLRRMEQIMLRLRTCEGLDLKKYEKEYGESALRELPIRVSHVRAFEKTRGRLVRPRRRF